MNATANKLDIKKLKAVQAKFNRDRCMPILDCCLIQNGNIIFYDMENYVILKNVIENKTIDCLVDSKAFVQVLELINNEPFELDQQSDGKLYLTTGPDNFNFNYLETKEFPDFDFEDTFFFAGEICKTDLENIYRAYNFTSRSEIRPQLQQVYFNHKIVGTDGHKMFFKKTVSKVYGVNLLNKKVVELLKNLKPESVTLLTDNKHRKIKFDNIEIIFRMYEGPYPDFEEAIPHASSITGIMKSKIKDLQNLIKKAQFALDPATRQLIFDFSNGPKLSARDTNRGLDYSGELKASIKGQLERFGVDCIYLSEVIKQITEPCLRLNFVGPNNAMILNNEFLLMPVRLKEN